MSKPLADYCVTYQFNGHTYWERVKVSNPKTIPNSKQFKNVKIVSIELEPEEKTKIRYCPYCLQQLPKN